MAVSDGTHMTPTARNIYTRAVFATYSFNFGILTTLTRDIQCEKFIEDESVTHEPCDSMYPNIH